MIPPSSTASATCKSPSPPLTPRMGSLRHACMSTAKCWINYNAMKDLSETEEFPAAIVSSKYLDVVTITAECGSNIEVFHIDTVYDYGMFQLEYASIGAVSKVVCLQILDACDDNYVNLTSKHKEDNGDISRMGCSAPGKNVWMGVFRNCFTLHGCQGENLSTVSGIMGRRRSRKGYREGSDTGGRIERSKKRHTILRLGPLQVRTFLGNPKYSTQFVCSPRC